MRNLERKTKGRLNCHSDGSLISDTCGGLSTSSPCGTCITVHDSILDFKGPPSKTTSFLVVNHAINFQSALSLQEQEAMMSTRNCLARSAAEKV